MSKDAMIRARVEGSLKDEVEKILSRLGVSPSEAINIFYRQIQLRKGLPFAVEIPSKTTRKTFEDTDAGKNISSFQSEKQKFEDLGI